MTTTRTVSRKPVTSFDVSPNGKLLAVGSADMSVGIFSADGVRVCSRHFDDIDLIPDKTDLCHFPTVSG